MTSKCDGARVVSAESRDAGADHLTPDLTAANIFFGLLTAARPKFSLVNKNSSNGPLSSGVLCAIREIAAPSALV